MSTGHFRTVFGSLDSYIKGEIEIINDDRKHYAFSNVFEVAARSAPYEKVVVGKNREYVIEAIRAEGASDWFRAKHDEFALVMDGVLEIHLVRPEEPNRVSPSGTDGSIRMPERPAGKTMGRMKLGRGHQALLPEGAAYRFEAVDGVGVIVLQTILGPLSVEKWSEICYT